jgi:cysteinyl-tRNA synthetase
VRNVTDVDDKIINKAREEYPDEDLNSSFKKVSEKYLKSYHEALKSLCIEANGIIEPKASEYIPKMLTFIQGLIDKDAAYVSGGDVYFDITKAKNYGKLSNQAIDNMEAGARIALGEKKKSPLDFALWKTAKEGEPAWESPWGKGRPGWHIECSVMSSDILGDEFDIHGGGIDLIFPHHENEIAQSEGAGKKFARYWIHHGLLTINGQKMAKSLGNFITVKGFLDKYKNADLLKLLFLSTHYSHPVDYTEEKINEAKKRKKSFDKFFELVNTSRPIQGKEKPILSESDRLKIKDFCEDFEKAMDDDFNAPKALASLTELIDFVSARESTFKYGVSKVKSLFKVFGLTIKELVLPKEVENKLSEWGIARQKKDFKKADDIRDEFKPNYIPINTGSSISCVTSDAFYITEDVNIEFLNINNSKNKIKKEDRKKQKES